MAYLCETMLNMIQFTKGCTEPAAIAINAANVGKYLKDADKIELEIDKMTFKNAYRAGIPNAGDNIGVAFSAAYGYLIADPKYALEIFDGLNNDIIEKAKVLKEKIDIKIINTNDMLIKTKAYKKKETAYALTVHSHENIVEVYAQNELKIKKDIKKQKESEFGEELFDVSRWKQFAEEMYNCADLRNKMQEALNINIQASSLAKKYGDDSVFRAVYARMKGDKIRVASCAGSGNKGLTALINVYEYAQKIGADKENTLKAALLSCFVTSIITSRFGFISSICGVVHAASVGAMAGILFLKDKINLFNGAFKNFISANSGIICDGAKKSCAMKATSASFSMKKSIELAKNGVEMDYCDGLLGKTFYDTIKNIEQYKNVFGMFDMKTINILRGK
jgi:L-cysteine desulfidase